VYLIHCYFLPFKQIQQRVEKCGSSQTEEPSFRRSSESNSWHSSSNSDPEQSADISVKNDKYHHVSYWISQYMVLISIWINYSKILKIVWTIVFRHFQHKFQLYRDKMRNGGGNWNWRTNQPPIIGHMLSFLAECTNRIHTALNNALAYTYHWFSFCPFSFGHCFVCPSSHYGLWLPIRYVQTLPKKKHYKIKSNKNACLKQNLWLGNMSSSKNKMDV